MLPPKFMNLSLNFVTGKRNRKLEKTKLEEEQEQLISMFVNYGLQSYGPDDTPSTFATLVATSDERGTFAGVQLQFVRISFEEDCVPAREHIVGINTSIDQLPFELSPKPHQ